ncbi:hypothetical protein [Saccharopolyspora hattusasensis]|uniref:hypothetical protein n=1 Tax=Saccharopolyspora hattusasensis TaxID=1128679 RepID=UPI003D966054
MDQQAYGVVNGHGSDLNQVMAETAAELAAWLTVRALPALPPIVALRIDGTEVEAQLPPGIGGSVTAPDDTPTLRRPSAHPGVWYGSDVAACAHCDRTINTYTGGQWTHSDGPKCDPKLVAEIDAHRIRETLRELDVEDMRQAQKIAHALLDKGFGPVVSAQLAAQRISGTTAPKAVA